MKDRGTGATTLAAKSALASLATASENLGSKNQDIGNPRLNSSKIDQTDPRSSTEKQEISTLPASETSQTVEKNVAASDNFSQIVEKNVVVSNKPPQSVEKNMAASKKPTIYYAHQTSDTVRSFEIKSMKKVIQSCEIDSMKKPTLSVSTSKRKTKSTLSAEKQIVLNVEKRTSIDKTKFFIIKIPDEDDEIDKYERLKKLMIDFHEFMIRVSTIRHPKIRRIIKN